MVANMARASVVRRVRVRVRRSLSFKVTCLTRKRERLRNRLSRRTWVTVRAPATSRPPRRRVSPPATSTTFSCSSPTCTTPMAPSPPPHRSAAHPARTTSHTTQSPSSLGASCTRAAWLWASRAMAGWTWGLGLAMQLSCTHSRSIFESTLCAPCAISSRPHASSSSSSTAIPSPPLRCSRRSRTSSFLRTWQQLRTSSPAPLPHSCPPRPLSGWVSLLLVSKA
mmetsp:Transcript_20621/g.50238  ORF Transcript_20621/g.50238 Transcript_20621/m.50238 type:complete len:224 (-) Transcript_20621:179-850(-)